MVEANIWGFIGRVKPHSVVVVLRRVRMVESLTLAVLVAAPQVDLDFREGRAILSLEISSGPRKNEIQPIYLDKRKTKRDDKTKGTHELEKNQSPPPKGTGIHPLIRPPCDKERKNMNKRERERGEAEPFRFSLARWREEVGNRGAQRSSGSFLGRAHRDGFQVLFLIFFLGTPFLNQRNSRGNGSGG